MANIAFIGLGAMGSRMAAHLVKAGHNVSVWNRDPARAEAFCQQGGMRAVDPRAAAQEADFVFSMVTDDAAARAIWLDPKSGAAGALKSGAVAVECSTVTPAFIRELGRAIAAKAAHLLDAPVSGSRPQAEGAQLVFMVGGSADAFAIAAPVLESLAAKVMHVGQLGQGAVLKLAINALFAVQLEGVAEILGFLARNGFSREQAAELIGRFPILAPPIAGAAKMMAAKNNAPLFTIDLIEKDLRYVFETAKASGAELPGAANARAAFRKAQDMGLGDSNVSGLAAVFA